MKLFPPFPQYPFILLVRHSHCNHGPGWQFCNEMCQSICTCPWAWQVFDQFGLVEEMCEGSAGCCGSSLWDCTHDSSTRLLLRVANDDGLRITLWPFQIRTKELCLSCVLSRTCFSCMRTRLLRFLAVEVQIVKSVPNLRILYQTQAFQESSVRQMMDWYSSAPSTVPRHVCFNVPGKTTGRDTETLRDIIPNIARHYSQWSVPQERLFLHHEASEDWQWSPSLGWCCSSSLSHERGRWYGSK